MFDLKEGTYNAFGIRFKATGKSGKYKYVLLQDHTFYLLKRVKPTSHFYYRVHDRVCTIFAGYSWDGPSGPSIDTLNFMMPSLRHDMWYQLIREHIAKELKPERYAKIVKERYRNLADVMLRRDCLACGMSSIRAWWVYKAVRWFGASSAGL